MVCKMSSIILSISKDEAGVRSTVQGRCDSESDNSVQVKMLQEFRVDISNQVFVMSVHVKSVLSMHVNLLYQALI